MCWIVIFIRHEDTSVCMDIRQVMKKNIDGKRYLQNVEKLGNLLVYVICRNCGLTLSIEVEVGVGFSIKKVFL